MYKQYYFGPLSIDSVNGMWVASLLTDVPIHPATESDGIHSIVVTADDNLVGIHIDEKQVGGYFINEPIDEDDVVGIISLLIGMKFD